VEYISLSELYSYKDLILQLTRKIFRSISTNFIRSILVLLQPLLTVLVYVCNNVISTGTYHLFYLTLLALHCGVFFRKYLQTSKHFLKMLTFSIKYIFKIIVAISSLWLQLRLFSVNLLFLCGLYILSHYR
jgi:lipopolysaccharide transport system permease protein